MAYGLKASSCDPLRDRLECFVMKTGQLVAKELTHFVRRVYVNGCIMLPFCILLTSFLIGWLFQAIA